MSDTISLASGYGSFLTPTVATEAAVRAIRAGQLPLGDPAGLPALREALARRYQLAGKCLHPEQVVVTPGAKAALFAVLSTVLRPGDEVLLLTPHWFGFDDLVARAGGTLRLLPLSSDNNYELDPAQLRAALSPRTRVLLFSNPNNPTGRVYHAEALAELLSVTADFPGLYVLADEIYDLITFGSQPVPSLLDFPDPRQRHVVVNGFSKSLALVGWGVGYLVAPPAVARACAAWQHATGAAVAIPNQHAALAATRAAPGIASGLINQLHRNRQRLLERLETLPNVPPVHPEATYYAFPDLRAHLNPELPAEQASAELVACLLAAGVEVVDGTRCGAPGFVRLSYAVPEPVLRAGLNHLTHALAAGRCLREA